MRIKAVQGSLDPGQDLPGRNQSVAVLHRTILTAATDKTEQVFEKMWITPALDLRSFRQPIHGGAATDPLVD